MENYTRDELINEALKLISSSTDEQIKAAIEAALRAAMEVK